jgi:hypothetical protein
MERRVREGGSRGIGEIKGNNRGYTNNSGIRKRNPGGLG